MEWMESGSVENYILSVKGWEELVEVGYVSLNELREVDGLEVCSTNDIFIGIGLAEKFS